MTSSLLRGLAVPAITVGILGTGLVAAGTTSATAETGAPAATAVSPKLSQAQSRAAIRTEMIKRYGVYPLPVGIRQIERYRLKKGELRQIAKAKRFAATPKARSVRKCESGGNYRINTGNGYYGAYQFDFGTWLGNGGGRYARYANQAPAFAQDHIAYKTWLSRGWQPWACA